MFGAVMEDAALCRKVLETLLQTPVGELSVVESEKNYKATKDGRAIRLDIYASEKNSGNIYDAEMQNLNGDTIESLCLPKRSRYYQSMLDRACLKESSDYTELRDTNIIFVCTFDPFGKGHWRYDFSEMCEQQKDLKLCSGARKTFINTESMESDIPENARNLIKYISKGIVSDELTEELKMAVDTARLNSELKAEYERSGLALFDAHRQGKNEGARAAYYNMYNAGKITRNDAMEFMGLDEAGFAEYEKSIAH